MLPAAAHIKKSWCNPSYGIPRDSYVVSSKGQADLMFLRASIPFHRPSRAIRHAQRPLSRVLTKAILTFGNRSSNACGQHFVCLRRIDENSRSNR